MSIAHQIMTQARARPHSSALFAQGRSYTYAELAAGLDRAASLLDGVTREGEPVGILMGPDAESVTTFLAAAHAHHPAVLLGPALRPEEYAGAVHDAGVRILLVPAPLSDVVLPADVVRRTRQAGGHLHIMEFDGAADSAPYPPADTLLCQLTSGSLGRSRLAARTHRGVEAEIASVAERLRMDSADRVLCGSSIAHSYGLIGGLLAPLTRGAQCALPARPDQVPLAMDLVRPTIVFGLASTYRAMLRDVETGGLGSVIRLALSAGAPLPPGLFDAFLERFGLPIRQDYGTTETGTISIDAAEPAEPATVGSVLPHMEVRLVPPDRLSLEPWEQGEIRVRSLAVATGYVTRAGIAACTDDEGWYRTGDAGWWNANGRLCVGRRLRPPFRLGDAEIRPDAVEEAVVTMPGVHEALIVMSEGVSGPPRLVVVAPGITPDAVRQWLGAHLSSQAAGITVEMRGELPRSPAGKILQKYL